MLAMSSRGWPRSRRCCSTAELGRRTGIYRSCSGSGATCRLSRRCWRCRAGVGHGLEYAAALQRSGGGLVPPGAPQDQGELAACLGDAGDVEQGLATVETMLQHCRAREEDWYLPELLRIRGDLLLK